MPSSTERKQSQENKQNPTKTMDLDSRTGVNKGVSIMRLVVMVILLCDTVGAVKNQAYFNETGDLPCQFTNPQNISLLEMIIFWQDKKQQVLFELYNGIPKLSNVHGSYKGRTSFDQNSWTLHLHNVQIKDKGTYQCFIHHKKSTGLMLIHQMKSDLSVIANFSQPEIKLLSNVTENPDIINLTCSSSHGYPAPVNMWFSIMTGNSTTETQTSMMTSQNNATGLYDVSVSLSFPVPPGANSVNVSCVLQPESPEELLHSPFFTIDIKAPEPPPPTRDNDLWKLAAVASVLVPAMVLFLRKRKKKPADPSNESGTGQREGGENEQPHRRVDPHAPDTPTEAQCIITIPKTASGHESAARS